MELREYYSIWKRNLSVVIYGIMIFVVIAYAWSVRRSQTYTSSLLINLSRVSTQQTTDYRYDQYYRIEADDNFSDTIEQWIRIPGIASAIYEQSDLSLDNRTLRQLAKSFHATKMSPQAIEVRFDTNDHDTAQKISQSINEVISAKVKSLNESAKDPDWFKTDVSNFITVQNTQNIPLNLLLAAAAGLFFGSIGAFFQHYLKNPSKEITD